MPQNDENILINEATYPKSSDESWSEIVISIFSEYWNIKEPHKFKKKKTIVNTKHIYQLKIELTPSQ